MTKRKLIKSVLVFMLIYSFAIIPISNNPLEKQQMVFKESFPNEEVRVENSTEFIEIDNVLKDIRLQGTTTSISIRKAENGKIIYSHFGDTRVRPASIMKLLTGVAALETLGADHTFKTELYTEGIITGGVLTGNLYIRGQGDPTLTKDDLTTFVSELKTKGIHTITGNLYGDDTWYDADRLSQDLNWSDEPYYTGAQISGLTLSPNDDFDAGTVIVEVYPSAKKGETGTVRMLPENSYMTILNKTKTVAKNEAANIKVERLHGSNAVVVSGTIPLGLKQTRSWASVWEPTNYALNVFKHALMEQGIKVGDVTQIDRKTVPKEATLLMSKQSMPLKDLLIPFMKLSNNGHGEVLVKEMGQVIGGEGSWDKGLAVMDSTLANIGIDTTTLLLRDGSGMSHKNLVTTNEVSKLLYIAQEKSWYPALIGSLPVAGNGDRLTGGTLRYRMTNTAAAGNVKAKTGTLNGVSALSGYVKTKDGEELIFSAIINNQIDETAYEVLDKIAVILANYRTN